MMHPDNHPETLTSFSRFTILDLGTPAAGPAVLYAAATLAEMVQSGFKFGACLRPNCNLRVEHDLPGTGTVFFEESHMAVNRFLLQVLYVKRSIVHLYRT